MATCIAIIGATVSGNHGAEAMLAATIGRLRERVADCEFSVFSYYPRRDRKLVSISGTEIFSATPLHLVLVLFPFSVLRWVTRRVGIGHATRRLFPRCVRALERADCLVDLAGVSFIDGREKFLPFNILTILPAFLLGVPVVKFAQAMGPFRGRLNRVAARTFLTRCRFVFARGATTADHLVELGLCDTRWRAGADVAFLLRDEDGLATSPSPDARTWLEAMGRLSERPGGVVGICPSSVVAGKLGDGYAQVLASLVERLVAEGFGVVVFPNASRADEPEARFNNDLWVIRAMMRLAPEHARAGAIFVDTDLFAVEIKQVVERCDLVMVSRFHAMIGALASGVPPVVVGWGHKYAEVMHEFGLADHVLDFSELDLDRLLAWIVGAMNRLQELRADIASHRGAAADQAMRQIEYVTALLEAR